MRSYFHEENIALSLPRDGDIRTTLGLLHYYSQSLDEVIVVPKGLRTDLGSIPTILQWVFPKDGKAVFAYILHDYLYAANYQEDRSLCDDILAEAMEILKISTWRIKVIRFGLRIGGSSSWNKHRKDGR